MGNDENIQNKKCTGNKGHGVPGGICLQRMDQPASEMGNRPPKKQNQKNTASELKKTGFQTETACRCIRMEQGVKASGKIAAKCHQCYAQAEHIQVLAETGSKKAVVTDEKYDDHNPHCDIVIQMKEKSQTDSNRHHQDEKK